MQKFFKSDWPYLIAFFIFAWLLAGCDDVEVAHETETTRAGYWVEVACDVDDQCWGLHPMGATADVWAKLVSTTDLRMMIDAGELTSPTGVSGYGGCAGNNSPEPATPFSICKWDVSEQRQRCWGGDEEWVAEYRNYCVIDFNYAAAQNTYLPGSCAELWPMGLGAWQWVHGSVIEQDSVRAAANNGVDTIELRSGCSIEF